MPNSATGKLLTKPEKMPEPDKSAGNSSESGLLAHLEALRRTLLYCMAVTAVLIPAGYFAAPYAIEYLVQWSMPENFGKMYYFAPMEVFLLHLKVALILALTAGYPLNILFLWRFLLPALYQNERRILPAWLLASTVLFAGGAVFCVGFILPMVMNFSLGFAGNNVAPMLGLANFVTLAGWMMLAFGIMFQSPLIVLLAVKLNFISTASLAAKRSYVIVIILILAAIFTPPDVVSQLLLAIPAWLLFEAGLLLAKHLEKK